MRKTTKSTLAVARAAMKAARVLPLYSHEKSGHKYTLHQFFAILVLKEFEKTDYRGIVIKVAEWAELKKILGLEHSVPTHNAVWYAEQRIFKTAHVSRLLDETVRMGHPTGQSASVDSTGLDSSHASRYYVKRRGQEMTYKTYQKLSAVVDNDTHLFLCAVIDEGPTVDQVEFTDAVTRAHRRCRFRQLLADRGYDSEANHRLIREDLKADSVIKVRRQKDHRPPQASYRREMHEHFPLEAYGQRWQIESTFSQFKRTLRSSLNSRSDERRRQETAVRVVAFNIMLVLFCRHFSLALCPLLTSFEQSRSDPLCCYGFIFPVFFLKELP